MIRARAAQKTGPTNYLTAYLPVSAADFGKPQWVNGKASIALNRDKIRFQDMSKHLRTAYSSNDDVWWMNDAKSQSPGVIIFEIGYTFKHFLVSRHRKLEPSCPKGPD
jgi:hypothetical protein